MSALFETPVSAAISATITGAFGFAGKVVEAAGNTARGVGEAIGGALEGAMSPAPVTVVNSVGMAGEAAKSKVTGGGTIPMSPKKSARPVANAKMPTEKLLVIAVNYLSSIEKTLEQQLTFERTAAIQQATAEKEAAIEGKSFTSPFTNIRDSLTSLKDDAKERASKTGNFLAKAGVAALVGLSALGNMDTSALQELKSNWSALTDKLRPVIEMAQSFAAAVGVQGAAFATVGWMTFGWRGALFGLIASDLYDQAEGKRDPITGERTGGEGWTATIAKNLPLVGLALAPKTTLKYAWRGIKAMGSFAMDFVKRQAARFSAWLTEKAFVRFAFSAYGKNALWDLFLNYLKKRGEQYLLAEIAAVGAATAAASAAEAGIAATVVGIPVATVLAVVEKLIAAGFAAWLLWDLYQIWSEFSQSPEYKAQEAADEERARGQGAAASPVQSSSGTTDAAPAISSQGGDATALAPAATGSIDAILDKNPEQLTDAELRQLVEAQGRIEDPSGVTNNPGGILYGTGPLQDHQIGFKRANADSSVKVAVYDTPENGIRAAMENWRTSRYYKGKSVRAGLGTWSGGNGAHYAKMLGSVRPGYEGTDNPQGETGLGQSLINGAWALGEGAMEAVGNILRAALDTGNMKYVPLGSQLSGMTSSSSKDTQKATPPSGESVASAITPESNSTTKALTDMSKSLQNAVDLGLAEKTQTDVSQETAAQMSIRKANVTNDGKLECLDPNFPGSGGVEAYLQYYRMAA